MVKLVNTLHSGCSELKLLEVRVFSWALAIRLITGFFFIIMRVLFLHTIPYRHEINNLILDVSLNLKTSDFEFLDFPCLWSSGNILLNLYKLRKVIRENKIDIIHVYDYIDAYLVSKIVKGKGAKVVFSDYYYHDELKGFKKSIYQKTLNKVDHIILQSDSHLNWMKKSSDVISGKCSKLYHAYCFKRFDEFEYKSVRDEYFIEDLRYLIGTMGDFTPQRDMMSIFKMIKKLRRTGRNFMCVVAGDQIDEYDTYYDSCKYYYLINGLDNYITYIGRRVDDANLLSQLDLFVYNSNRETIAIPVIEAMASGINVVVNDCDLIREVTCNGKYALLYEEGNDMDFATKSREVLFNLEDYKLIAEVVKEESRQIFSIDRHIYGLKNIYSKLTNK